MAIGLVACTTAGDAYQERLDAWRAANVTSYVWTLEASEPVFGPHQVSVRVRDGEPVRAVANGKRVPIEGNEVRGVPVTVDALIQWLVRYADSAKSVQVRWNEHVGYPALISLDHSDAIDDEVTFRVVSFEALG
jgi:hypothetical protein